MAPHGCLWIHRICLLNFSPTPIFKEVMLIFPFQPSENHLPILIIQILLEQIIFKAGSRVWVLLLCKIDSDHLLIWRKIFCFQKKSSVFKKKSSVFRRNLLVWREKNLLFSSKSFCFQEKIFCFQMISSGRSSDLGKFKVDRSEQGQMKSSLAIQNEVKYR